MDLHSTLGTQRLLDLTPKSLEMTASGSDANNHDRGPCSENNLELEVGRGSRSWADGSKTKRRGQNCWSRERCDRASWTPLESRTGPRSSFWCLPEPLAPMTGV